MKYETLSQRTFLHTMLSLGCAFILLVGCNENPLDSSTPPREYHYLRITCTPSIVYAGDSVLFTVTQDVPLPPECDYRWEMQFGDTVRSKDNHLKAYIPSGRRLTVRVMRGSEREASFISSTYTIGTRISTGKFTIKPYATLWDVGVPLSFSSVYEGSLPFGSRIAWSLGDGTTIVTPARDTLRYTYSSAGSRDIEARLFIGRSDSVSAHTTTHVDVTARTPGRFISFRMDGIARKVLPKEYIGDRFVYDPILFNAKEYLRWEGNRFFLTKQSYGDTLFVEGAFRGDMIDSIRIIHRGTNYYKAGTSKSYSLLIRGVASLKDSIGVWKLDGTACRNALVDFTEVGTIEESYEKWSWADLRYNTIYYQIPWTFVSYNVQDTAKIRIEIKHVR